MWSNDSVRQPLSGQKWSFLLNFNCWEPVDKIVFFDCSRWRTQFFNSQNSRGAKIRLIFLGQPTPHLHLYHFQRVYPADKIVLCECDDASSFFFWCEIEANDIEIAIDKMHIRLKKLHQTREEMFIIVQEYISGLELLTFFHITRCLCSGFPLCFIMERIKRLSIKMHNWVLFPCALCNFRYTYC